MKDWIQFHGVKVVLVLTVWVPAALNAFFWDPLVGQFYSVAPLISVMSNPAPQPYPKVESPTWQSGPWYPTDIQYHLLPLSLRLSKTRDGRIGQLSIGRPPHVQHFYLIDTVSDRHGQLHMQFSSQSTPNFFEIIPTPNQWPNPFRFELIQTSRQRYPLEFAIMATSPQFNQEVLGMPPTRPIQFYSQPIHSIQRFHDHVSTRLSRPHFSQFKKKLQQKEYPSASREWMLLKSLNYEIGTDLDGQFKELETHHHHLQTQVVEAEIADDQFDPSQVTRLSQVKQMIQKFQAIDKLSPSHPWVDRRLQSLIDLADTVFYAKEYAKVRTAIYAKFEDKQAHHPLEKWNKFELDDMLAEFEDLYQKTQDPQIERTIQYLNHYVNRLIAEAKWNNRSFESALVSYIDLYETSGLFQPLLNKRLDQFIRQRLKLTETPLKIQHHFYETEYLSGVKLHINAPFDVETVRLRASLYIDGKPIQRRPVYFWQVRSKPSKTKSVVYKADPAKRSASVRYRIDEIILFPDEPDYLKIKTTLLPKETQTKKTIWKRY